MMPFRWPWVGRLAYDTVMARLEDAQQQIEWLRDEHDKLVDHFKRLDRVQQGVGEIPREPRPPIEPMPKTLSDHINGFANPGIRREMNRRAYKRRSQGEPWAMIELDIRGEDEPGEPVMPAEPAEEGL